MNYIRVFLSLFFLCAATTLGCMEMENPFYQAPVDDTYEATMDDFQKAFSVHRQKFGSKGEATTFSEACDRLQFALDSKYEKLFPQILNGLEYQDTIEGQLIYEKILFKNENTWSLSNSSQAKSIFNQLLSVFVINNNEEKTREEYVYNGKKAYECAKDLGLGDYMHELLQEDKTLQEYDSEEFPQDDFKDEFKRNDGASDNKKQPSFLSWSSWSWKKCATTAVAVIALAAAGYAYFKTRSA